MLRSTLSAAVAAGLLRWWMDVPLGLAAAESVAVTALLAGWALWVRLNIIETAGALVLMGVLIVSAARLASLRWPAVSDGLSFLWIVYPLAAANAAVLAGRARRSDYHAWLARAFDPSHRRERAVQDPTVLGSIARHRRKRARREGR